MHKIWNYIIVALVLVSCKPNQTAIVTSKKEAQKKKIYTPYTTKNNTEVATTTANSTPATTPKKVKTITVVREPEGISETKPKKTPLILDQNDEDIVVTSDDTPYLTEQLINNAMDYLGSPYRGGGTSRNGFDCSGLMFTTFKTFDIILPRSSHEMARIGRVLDRNEYRRGDLIFFRTNGRRTINHVGMITEVSSDEIKFVHSSTQLGVVVSSTKEPYYQRTFAQVNRVIE
ncbi:Cell wall-associated hydrolase, NlpC family [Flavobacterium fontis]|uniref:Cell wall-associated hydrolase, NlpC family n=1 Tax=Flavobacterium fontis TaxID=1124188 RepID=A0A1M4XVR1_9FLAO|nr:C40 family peptidase [Flavobacterium fontis]SHE97674.1 Cell wall-associated hydrolase, NlpC family [Flavobacterium fontis]